nr:nucleotidyltransferase family protein [uncultured Desulfobacter sp.]
MNFTKEIDLILACSASAPSEIRKQRIADLIIKDLDWDYILNFSKKNGVLPLLFLNLSAVDKTVISSTFFQRLEEYYYLNAARCLKIKHHLFNLLDVLQAKGIPAIPFKGPTQAQLHYGDETLRSYSDVDILVPTGKMEDLCRIMAENNFRTIENFCSANLGAYLKFENSVNFVSLETTLTVEVHWHLMGIFLNQKLTYEYFEKDLLVLDKAGIKYLQFSDEDYLLYLILHGSKHAWESLDMVCSVAQIIRKKRDSLDWMRLRRSAGNLSAVRMLNLGLDLSNKLLNAPIPKTELDKALQDKKLRRIAGKRCLNLFTNKQSLVSNVAGSRYTLFHAEVRENIADAIRYGLKLLFYPSSKEIRSYDIPSCLYIYYYVKRLVRLLFEGLTFYMSKNTTNHGNRGNYDFWQI